MQIPFFRYPHVFEQHRSVIERVLVETASRGGYIMQRQLREFEERLAEYCGTGYAVGVGNATDGLELIVSNHGGWQSELAGSVGAGLRLDRDVLGLELTQTLERVAGGGGLNRECTPR